MTLADPDQYSSMYGESLLDTNELLSQIRQLGFTDALVKTLLVSSSSLLLFFLSSFQQIKSLLISPLSIKHILQIIRIHNHVGTFFLCLIFEL